MARLVRLCFSLILVLLFSDLIISTDPPNNSPAPAPESGSDSPISEPPSLANGAPASSPSTLTTPEMITPPAPAPSGDAASGSSPTPSPAPLSDASEINHESAEAREEDKEGSSSGLTAGKKAGIVIAVIVGAGLAGLGVLVYKKRKDNLMRSQYGYAARREFL